MHTLNSSDMFAVFQAAEKRVNNKTASNEDKVVVNLWYTQRRVVKEKGELKAELAAAMRRNANLYNTNDVLGTKLAQATGEYQKDYLTSDVKVVDVE